MDPRNLGKYRGVGDAQAIYAPYPKVRIQHCRCVIVGTDLGSAAGVVDGVGVLPHELTELVVTLQLGPGCHFTHNPILEFACLGELAGDPNAFHQHTLVLVVGVGEVGGVEDRLVGVVGRREAHGAAAARTRDVRNESERDVGTWKLVERSGPQPVRDIADRGLQVERRRAVDRRIDAEIESVDAFTGGPKS
jgi:hypothetical protein